jgi:hypothetical protein
MRLTSRLRTSRFCRTVQKEMGVSEGQRAKMNAHAKKYDTDARAYIEGLRKAGRPLPQSPMADSTLVNLLGGLRTRVLGELKAGQVKRLREITLQQAGLAGMLDPNVATRLGITPAVLSQMQSTFSDGRQRAGQLEARTMDPIVSPYQNRKPKDDAERKKLQAEMDAKVTAAAKRIRPQIEAIQKDTQTKILALATKKQRDAYVALQGKPFRG